MQTNSDVTLWQELAKSRRYAPIVVLDSVGEYQEWNIEDSNNKEYDHKKNSIEKVQFCLVSTKLD